MLPFSFLIVYYFFNFNLNNESYPPSGVLVSRQKGPHFMLRLSFFNGG